MLRSRELVYAGLAAVLLDLRLVALDVAFVALIGDHGQDVDLRIVDAAAILIDGESDAPSDLLSLPHLGDSLVQRANLEDVRVVPTLTERGVREDEGDRLIERK